MSDIDISTDINIIWEEVKKPYNYTSLVISGGSIKGIISLGVLQYTWDNFYLNNINTYIGTSIGAIIGYLLVIGCTPIEIIKYLCVNRVFENIPPYNIANMSTGEGTLSFDHIQKHLETITVEKIGKFLTLDQLYEKTGKKLICCTYNLTKDIVEYLSKDTYPDMPCLTAVKMSSNLPFIFPKFRYMDSTYIDGGMGDNFPIHLADKKGEKVLGINMLPEVDGFPKESENNITEYLFHLLFVPMLQLVKIRTEKTSKRCDIININHQFDSLIKMSSTTTEKLDMFSKGYEQAKEYFNKKTDLN